jgi:O-antigen ligase
MLRLGRNLAYIGFLLMPVLYLRLFRNFTLSDAFILASFLIFVIANPSRVLGVVSKNPLNVPFFIFFIGFSLSILFADQPTESFFALVQLLFCIYIVTTLIYLCNIKTVLAMIAVSVAIHSILAVLFLAGLLDIGVITMPFSRLSMGDVEPNVAARVFFVGAAIMFFSHSKVKTFIFRWLTVFAMLATFSRSGFLALIPLFAGISRKKPILFLAAAVIVIILVAFTPVGAIGPINAYIGRIMDALHLADANTRDRLFMIERGLEILAETWLIGVGMNNHPIDVGAVHNVFVNVAVETGIFGLIGYLLIYFVIFKMSRSLEKRLGMLTVMVVGTFLFDMFMSVSQNRIFWFPFSLVLAMYLQRLHFSYKHISDKASIEPKCAKSI